MAGYYAELVGFAIFIGLIIWKIVPLVRPLLDRRRETIRASIDGAEAALRGAETELERRKALLDEARVEARTIVENAESAAAQLREDGRARAEADYERTVRDAHAEIERETQLARDEVAREVGEIALAAAERVVRAEIDPARQHALVDQVIAAAQSTGTVR
jgi:F-type H+-transporting ATPase subunit b